MRAEKHFKARPHGLRGETIDPDRHIAAREKP